MQPQPVVYAQPIIMAGPMALGRNPQATTCPQCRAQIQTRVDYTVGVGAWVGCLICCFLGFDYGCCLIPFCVDAAKDANHYCPNCNAMIGTKSVI